MFLFDYFSKPLFILSKPPVLLCNLTYVFKIIIKMKWNLDSKFVTSTDLTKLDKYKSKSMIGL